MAETPWAKLFYVGPFDGPKGVAASPKDLALFGQELAKITSFEDNRLLNDKTVIRKVFSPVTLHNRSYARSHGPMWREIKISNTQEPIIWSGHTGTSFGERALLFVSPKLGYGLSIQWNANDAKVYSYAQTVIDEVAKEMQSRPTLNNHAQGLLADVRQFMDTSALPVSANTVPHPPARPEQLEPFVGRYYVSAWGYSDLAVNSEGHLELSMFGKKFPLMIENLAEGQFRFLESAGVWFQKEPIRFTFDEKGDVDGFFAAWMKYFHKK